ncbi:MAG: bifunctional nuclease family protein [Candidatus Latescibacteria bacterium]|nr:bifunctional nuclease family protein [Candidatus Latescibacterota bacterium]
MVQMKVVAVGIEPTNHAPFVLLKNEEEEMALLIGIGIFEATQISMKLEHQQPPRPMTHDLLKSVLDGLGAKVSKVFVNKLAQDTFFAQITLEMNGAVVEIDSRPSDAIALALRVEAPIYVAEDVLDQAGLRVKGTGEEGEMIPGQPDVSWAVSKAAKLGKKIGVLRVRLKKAVEEEDYETAAAIRDEIREFEQGLEGN